MVDSEAKNELGDVPLDEPNHDDDVDHDREEPNIRVEPSEPTKPSDHEGGRMYLWLSCLVVLIGVTLIVVMVTVVGKDDDNDDDDDDDLYTPAPTLVPTYAPPQLTLGAQDRLDLLREAVTLNAATLQYLDTSIPASANDLIGKTSTSTDPVTRAASWVVRSDEYLAQREIVTRFVLAVLWFNNGGVDNDWIVDDNWMEAVSVCEWHGVSCCKDFHPQLDPIQCHDKSPFDVVELDLHDNNLSGRIPASLALLEHCHSLWLSNNLLQGTLDVDTFRNMASLVALYVHNNQLTGEIRGELRDNHHLDTLFSHGNEFSGVWPLEFCPACVKNNRCDHAPVAWTLDCEEMTCTDLACCNARSAQRSHCIMDGTMGLTKLP